MNAGLSEVSSSSCQPPCLHWSIKWGPLVVVPIQIPIRKATCEWLVVTSWMSLDPLENTGLSKVSSSSCWPPCLRQSIKQGPLVPVPPSKFPLESNLWATCSRIMNVIGPISKCGPIKGVKLFMPTPLAFINQLITWLLTLVVERLVFLAVQVLARLSWCRSSSTMLLKLMVVSPFSAVCIFCTIQWASLNLVLARCQWMDTWG